MASRESNRSSSAPGAPDGASRSSRAQRAVVAVVIVGLAITVFGTLWSLSRAHRLDTKELERNGELLVFETQSLLDEVAFQVTAAGGLFRASSHVTPFEFQTFVSDIGLKNGMIGLGYVPIVPAANLDDWLESTRLEIPGLEVFELDADGRPQPLGDRALRFPLLYFEPVDLFSSMAGLDIAFHDDWRDLLLTSLDKDGIVMTPFIELGLPAPLDDYDQFIMGWPIADTQSGSVDELVIAVVDLGVLIDSNVSPEVTDRILWEVADVTDGAAGTDSGDGAWTGELAFGGRTWQFGIRLANRSGGVLSGTTGYPLFGGLIVTALSAFVAQLLVARLQSRRRMATLESLSESKDDFLAAVSHRLRTPLTAVVGFSEILRDVNGEISDGDRRELVSTIAIQAIELGHLFDNLLTVTRDADRAYFSPARVDVATEIHAVLDTAEPARRAKVRLVSADPDVEAAGDPGLVRQIIRNLIANATDHGDRVEVVVVADGPVARVTVLDNGPGIPHDRVSQVFDLYHHSGDDSGQPESMGVGLFVSRRLARRMSGDITYRRSEEWTCFELTLAAIPAPLPTKKLGIDAPVK